MALPILDGNQSATTLSTIITGGAHIPAHTVVSLGTQAKSDITSAISGSVVSISNFPSTQTIVGTVTANLGQGLIDEIGDVGSQAPRLVVGVYDVDGIQLGANRPFPISGAVTANDSGALTIVNSSTVTKADVKFTAIAGAYNATEVAQGYTLSPINVDIKGISYVDGQYVNYRNTCVAELVGQGGPAWKAQLIASSVTVSNSVTIGSLPAISGTVTANLSNTVTATWKGAIGSSNAVPIVFAQEGQAGGSAISYDGSNTSLNVNVKGSLPNISGTVTVGNSVTIGSLPAISGTVTANVLGYSDNEASYQPIPVVPWDEGVNTGRAVVVKVQQEGVGPLPISGTVTANGLAVDTVNAGAYYPIPLADSGEAVIIDVRTFKSPSGSLTTRFGTPTTANVSFATSAVTNANRKYLLIQNVTTGSNVITVGIGFTPTTTQGIQLTAGAGITFESSYIPTGAVYVLSSVTASNFTILEA